MYDNIKITTGDYINILESIKDHSENRVCARFLYLNNVDAREGWSTDIKSSQVLSVIINLKVRFADRWDDTKIYLSMSRQGNVDDRDRLLSVGRNCMLDKNKPFSDMEPWLVLYEWYMRQCLMIKIEDIDVRKASIVISSGSMWLIDQETSVSEAAMRRVLEQANGLRSE